MVTLTNVTALCIRRTVFVKQNLFVEEKLSFSLTWAFLDKNPRITALLWILFLQDSKRDFIGSNCFFVKCIKFPFSFSF